VNELQDLRVPVRDGEVHLLRGGSGEPVLYLHGGAGSGHWGPVHQLLSAQFDVIAPDHPGFGLSDVMDELDSIDDLVYHYLDLLGRLGLSRVHTVGVSFGGWLAAELAVHSPERVGALVLAAPTGLRLVEHPITDIFLMSAKERTQALFHDPGAIPEADPADTKTAFQDYKNMTALARFAWVPFMANPKLERRLYRVTAPTLVIAAEHDAVLPQAHCERYAQAIPGARLQVLAGSGHAMDTEAPAAFAAAVTAFLRPNGAQAA
jgi:pimeloyl-ACP methyl ester carboxylesterase